jgi:hypothetical protein
MCQDQLSFTAAFRLPVTRDDYLTAVVLSFDACFSHCTPALLLSTSPRAKYTHWRQSIFYLPEALTVSNKEVVTGMCSLTRICSLTGMCSLARCQTRRLSPAASLSRPVQRTTATSISSSLSLARSRALSFARPLSLSLSLACALAPSRARTHMTHTHFTHFTHTTQSTRTRFQAYTHTHTCRLVYQHKGKANGLVKQSFTYKMR